MRTLVLAVLFSLSVYPLFADESSFYYQDALFQYAGGRYSQSAVNLQLALRGDSQNWKVRQLLGYCYYRMNDEKAALDECRESLLLHGGNPRLRDFVQWLESPSPRAMRVNSSVAYMEGPQEAEMPPPPDLVPEKSPSSKVPAPTDPLLDVLKHFRFQMGPGLDFLGENYDTSFRTFGRGGEFALGYALDDRWSFWLGGGFYGLPEIQTASQVVFPATLDDGFLAARYRFGGGLLRPYLTAGLGWTAPLYVGYGLFTYQYPFYAPVYAPPAPTLRGRVGLECPLDPGLSLFLESGANVAFENLTYTWSSLPPFRFTTLDYPIDLGLILSPWNGQGRSPAPAMPNGGFFVKTGGGFALDPVSYNGSSQALGTFFGALGYDFPDNVSVFADLERFSQEWAVMANLQLTSPTDTIVEPYLYGGVGLDLPSSAGYFIGVALQVAMGLQFQVDRDFALYTELRDYASYLYDPYVDNLLGNTLLEAGFKVDFPDLPASAKTRP